ncbi:hypothetical protein [Methyloprofundus sp.]|uniref:hypothetical protein n=1 Tax=Methyloprofundus sp. TaxID=2020875 RepID=UPI003D0C79C1
MKNLIIFLLIGTSFTLSHSSFANLIYPGKISHFNDGSLDGWSKGPRSNLQPEIITDELGRQYLEVTSVGELTFESERDPDSRLRVMNRSSWLTNYNLLGITALKVSMANLGTETLHMRLFFGDTRQEKICMTATAVELAPDKQWQEVIFSMQQPELICGTIATTDRIIQPAAVSVAELKKTLNNIFIMSLETPESNGKIEGKLGVDDIQALTYASLGFVANSARTNQPAIIDLHTDVVADGELIQHIHNTSELTTINGMPLEYLLNENSGTLEAVSAGKIENLRPVSAILTERDTAGASYNEDGYKQLFTANNRRITTFPQSNAEADFASLLQTLGLNIEHDRQGNLAVIPQGGNKSGSWFSVRVDAVSTLSDAALAPRLSSKEYSNLAGVVEFIHNYTINNDLYQQSYHAVPADWGSLKGYFLNILKATHARLSATGVINLLIAGVEYNARMAALVSPYDGSSELAEEIELHAAGDINKDGLPDFKVVYENGQSQIIYLLP